MTDHDQPENPLLSIASELLGEDDSQVQLLEDLLADDFDSQQFAIRQLLDEN
ncbi:MAG: hypothetical protein M3335_00840 [Actinomycetota bacterium]|nr:hypothetical protein [Actinomycetota bacterium]